MWQHQPPQRPHAQFYQTTWYITSTHYSRSPPPSSGFKLEMAWWKIMVVLRQPAGLDLMWHLSQTPNKDHFITVVLWPKVLRDHAKAWKLHWWLHKLEDFHSQWQWENHWAQAFWGPRQASSTSLKRISHRNGTNPGTESRPLAHYRGNYQHEVCLPSWSPTKHEDAWSLVFEAVTHCQIYVARSLRTSADSIGPNIGQAADVGPAPVPCLWHWHWWVNRSFWCPTLCMGDQICPS